jgi:hypothetical protein
MMKASAAASSKQQQTNWWQNGLGSQQPYLLGTPATGRRRTTGDANAREMARSRREPRRRNVRQFYGHWVGNGHVLFSVTEQNFGFKNFVPRPHCEIQ